MARHDVVPEVLCQQSSNLRFPPQAIAYFKTQWWTDRERWAELHARKHVNFGISITSRH
ncbi:hypothetical protein V1520DRAFT_350886 [Lipomyces starkeyi]